MREKDGNPAENATLNARIPPNPLPFHTDVAGKSDVVLSSSMNPTLQEIHDLLLTHHTTLSGLLDSVADPHKAKVIITEMQQILHRIDLVQSLPFRNPSQQQEKTRKRRLWTRSIRWRICCISVM